MSEFNLNQEKLINLITKEFVDKISHTAAPNLGIFKALRIICERGNLWELSVLLCVAEKEPIKIETVVSGLDENISKSSVYRKISAFIQDKLLKKDDEGYLTLHSDLQSLGIIAKLHKNLNQNQ